MYALALPLEPVGRPRQRFRIVQPKGKRPFIAPYKTLSDPYEVWRGSCVTMLAEARRRQGGCGLSGPLGVKAVFLFPMPEGEHRKRMPRPRRWHTAKPDIDNVLKAVLDSMVEAEWMTDDAYVAQSEVQKIVAAQGEPPAIHVTLFALPVIAADSPAKVGGGDLFRNVGEDGLKGFKEPEALPEVPRRGRCRTCGGEWVLDDSSGQDVHVHADLNRHHAVER